MLHASHWHLLLLMLHHGSVADWREHTTALAHHRTRTGLWKLLLHIRGYLLRTRHYIIHRHVVSLSIVSCTVHIAHRCRDWHRHLLRIAALNHHVRLNEMLRDNWWLSSWWIMSWHLARLIRSMHLHHGLRRLHLLLLNLLRRLIVGIVQVWAVTQRASHQFGLGCALRVEHHWILPFHARAIVIRILVKWHPTNSATKSSARLHAITRTLIINHCGTGKPTLWRWLGDASRRDLLILIIEPS